MAVMNVSARSLVMCMMGDYLKEGELRTVSVALNIIKRCPVPHE